MGKFTFVGTALAVAVMSSTTAFAATLPLPTTGKPAATVKIPDDWSHRLTGEGAYDIASKDGSVVVAIGTDPKLKTEAELAAEAAKELGKDIEIVPGSIGSGKDQVNGMKAIVTGMEIKAKGADRGVTLTMTQIITPKPDIVIKVVVMNMSKDKEREAELETMFSSLKMVE